VSFAVGIGEWMRARMELCAPFRDCSRNFYARRNVFLQAGASEIRSSANALIYSFPPNWDNVDAVESTLAALDSSDFHNSFSRWRPGFRAVNIVFFAVEVVGFVFLVAVLWLELCQKKSGDAV
jgi:hypothetical protein